VEVETRHCPVCGAAFSEGRLYARGYSTGKAYVVGSLWWRANRKIPRERPFRLFGRAYFAEKAVRVRLLGGNGLFAEEARPYEVPGWYCPNCKNVFAWFNAPGVPPELNPGEGSE